MTKKDAIKRARELETESCSWNDRMEMWSQVTVPAGVSAAYDLKHRRIERALELLGVDEETAYCYASNFGPGSFREAVYKYDVKMTYEVYDSSGCLVSDDLTSLKAISADLKNANVEKSETFEAIRDDGMYVIFMGHTQQSRLERYAS